MAVRKCWRLGPELTSFGIADSLLDPTLDLVDSNGIWSF
jgi:hypothetical protein